MAKSKVITMWVIWLVAFPSLVTYAYMEFKPDFSEQWLDLLAFAIVICAVAVFPIKVGNITVFFSNGVSLAAFLYFGLLLS